MKRTGSGMIIEALKKEGVDVIFGYPGGVVIPVFDELFAEASVHLVLTRHEQAAVHAADGYARSTGKTGVVLVTSGPGATNTVTGLATANFDAVPLVVLTGQVPRSMIGNDAFQEADIVGISRPVTKHNYLVLDRKDLGRVLKEAFYIARSGKPGPVLVDIPKDVITEAFDDEYPQEVSIRGYNPVTVGHAGQIKKIAEAIKLAKKPLFYIGGGLNIANAGPIFRKIVDKVKIPTISSLMGIGVLPHAHEYYTGMVGMHGTYTSNMAVTECDLLIAIGTRFDDRVTMKLEKFAPQAEIIHIDIDPSSIARNVSVKIPVVGDAKNILEELEPLLVCTEIDEWRQKVAAMKKEHPLPEGNGSNGLLAPQEVIKAVGEVFEDAIICTEVGQNQMWTALYYNFRSPRSFLTSGGLGTMGYGFPAAIGAQVGNRNRKVIDMAGDGSIQMNIQELATCVQEGLPVIVCILNNGYLGMVRQWQQLFNKSRYSGTCLMRKPSCPLKCTAVRSWCHHYSVDFVKLAEAYGGIGLRVQKTEEIKPALEEAGRSKDKPVLIDFIIEREANVFPMVPPGSGINEMLID